MRNFIALLALIAMSAVSAFAGEHTEHVVSLKQVIENAPLLKDSNARADILTKTRAELDAEDHLTPEQREVIYSKAVQIAEAAAVATPSDNEQAADWSLSVPDLLPTRTVDIRASFTSYPDWLALCVEGHPWGRSDNRKLRQLGIQGCVSTVIFFSSLTVGANYRFNVFARRDRAAHIHEINVGPQVDLRWVMNGAVAVDLMASGEYVWWVRPNQLGITATVDAGLSLGGTYNPYFWGSYLTGNHFWAVPIFRLMGGVAFK